MSHVVTSRLRLSLTPAKMRTRLAPTAKDIERRSRNRASTLTSSDILVHLQNIPKMLWSEDILSESAPTDLTLFMWHWKMFLMCYFRRVPQSPVASYRYTGMFVATPPSEKTKLTVYQ